MAKRTIAQAARNIVNRQNVKITTQEFQAFKRERNESGNPKNSSLENHQTSKAK